MFTLLSVPIHNLSRSEIEDWILKRLSSNPLPLEEGELPKAEGIESKKFHHIATVNPEFLVEAKKNKKFADILKNRTSLNVCDGFGICFWAKVLYKKSIQRITGVELAETICRVAAEQKKSVYFLGGFGVADKAAQVMKQKYLDLIIAGTEDGSPNTINYKLKNSAPDVVLVSFGAPKQEYWLQEFGAESGAKIGIGIGGTFDFWTGQTIRAPKFFRFAGLEWFWRLVLYPQRWRRIWNATVVFSWMVVREFFCTKK
jgi:N-acetylglucosaminyldiphosphoundecaprenol N-acetyl-beta-D-mannosaminyltransferase